MNSERQKFIFQDQEIYQWEQNIDEVNIYIKPPQYVLPKFRDEVKKQLKDNEPLPKIQVTIKYDWLKVGIQGNPPFIDEKLFSKCIESESTWLIEDEELQINLQKALKAEVWQSALLNHQNQDPMYQQQVQQQILLQRFQEENPGFDFSQAQFNGSAPDPRKFMGGLNYQ